MGRRKGRFIGAVEFIEIWENCDDLREVSERTGMRIEACRNRAHKYAKKGVPLTELRSNTNRLNYGYLAQVAREARKLRLSANNT